MTRLEQLPARRRKPGHLQRVGSRIAANASIDVIRKRRDGSSSRLKSERSGEETLGK